MKFTEGYNEIKASDNLKKRIKRSFFKDRIVKIGANAGSVVAAMVVLVAVGVNVSPSFAAAMDKVPIIGEFIKVVPGKEYENKIGNSEAKIVTPKIEGLRDEKLAEELNRELGENAEKLIAEFEKEAEILLKEFGGEAHMGVESSYVIRTDNEDYYAIDIYFFNAVGSSSTTHKFYTIDKKSGELVVFKNLFKDESNYKERLGEIVKKEMIRRNNEEDGMFWVDEDDVWQYEGVEDDVNFYINENGNIVICYDKYEVAAGAQGCPEFEIDTEDIRDILN